MIKNKNNFAECSYDKIYAYINENLLFYTNKFGGGSVGFALSDTNSDEEIGAVFDYAKKISGEIKILTFDEVHTEPVAIKTPPVRLKAGVNNRGLYEAGVKYKDQKFYGGLKAIFIFGGEARGLEMMKPDFLAVACAYENETANRADCVLPIPNFYETEGAFTDVNGKKYFKPAVFMPKVKPLVEIITALSKNLH